MSRLLPTISVTTRHSVSVYPWQVGASLPLAGPVLGLNQLGGPTAFCYDPWECYAAGALSSPNMLVLGQLGTGKSALVKTYLHRQLLAGRRAFVLDPKGEYAPLARRAGLTLVPLAPGGSARLNPLDPGPADSCRADTDRRRTGLAAALAAGGLGAELTAEQRAGLAAAVGVLPEAATLGDLVGRLLDPSAAMSRPLRTDPPALAAALRPVALELRRLLAGDLAGMLDGPSTVELRPDGCGVVLDLSAVFGGDGLGPVMLCAGAWLSAALNHSEARRTLLLLDEAWALLGSPATTGWLQSVSKLARRFGVQLITVVHRLSDLTGQADSGTAAWAQARGLLADAQTVVLYQQSQAERDQAARLLGLSQTAAGLLHQLPPRRALWLVGGHAAVVDHLLAPGEEQLTDTDTQMRP